MDGPPRRFKVGWASPQGSKLGGHVAPTAPFPVPAPMAVVPMTENMENTSSSKAARQNTWILHNIFFINFYYTRLYLNCSPTISLHIDQVRHVLESKKTQTWNPYRDVALEETELGRLRTVRTQRPCRLRSLYTRPTRTRLSCVALLSVTTGMSMHNAYTGVLKSNASISIAGERFIVDR